MMTMMGRRGSGEGRESLFSSGGQPCLASLGVDNADLGGREGVPHRPADVAGVVARVPDRAPHAEDRGGLGEAPAVEDLEPDDLVEVVQALGQRPAAAHKALLDADRLADLGEGQGRGDKDGQGGHYSRPQSDCRFWTLKGQVTGTDRQMDREVGR